MSQTTQQLKHISILSQEETKTELDPMGQDPLKDTMYLVFNNPTGTTMTPTIVNALRRVMLGEVQTYSLSPSSRKNQIVENTSEFNPDYISQRLSLVPIYWNSGQEEFQPNEYVFRICDPNDWSKSLVNNNPAPLRINVYQPEDAEATPEQVGLVVLRKKEAYRQYNYTMNQLAGRSKNWPDEISGLEQKEKEEQEALAGKTIGNDDEQDQKKDVIDGDEEQNESDVIFKSHEDWTERFDRLTRAEVERLVLYDFYLAKLQYHQKLQVNIIPASGIGQNHATFQGGIISEYQFLKEEAQPIGIAPIKPGEYHTSNRVWNRKPTAIRMGLEFNGHQTNDRWLEAGLAKLHSKFKQFRTAINNLDLLTQAEEGTGEPEQIDQTKDNVVDLTRKMDASLQAENLVLKVNRESHTLGSLIKTYGTFLLQRQLWEISQNSGLNTEVPDNAEEGAVSEAEAKYREWLYKSFCSYRMPHPLRFNIEFHLKVPSDLPKELSVYYKSHRPAVQLLLMTLDHIDTLLEELTNQVNEATKDLKSEEETAQVTTATGSSAPKVKQTTAANQVLEEGDEEF